LFRLVISWRKALENDLFIARTTQGEQVELLALEGIREGRLTDADGIIGRGAVGGVRRDLAGMLGRFSGASTQLTLAARVWSMDCP